MCQVRVTPGARARDGAARHVPDTPTATATATAPIDDRPLLRPRYAPSTRVGGQLDSMLGPTRGLAARAWASMRFRAPVALRVRVRPAGFAMIEGSAQPMGAVDAAFGLDTGPVGLHAGAGVGWLLRRRRELSSDDGQTFGFGHYVMGGARVGDADSFGVDIEASFAMADQDDVGVTLEVQLDIALRFALGPVVLELRLGSSGPREDLVGQAGEPNPPGRRAQVRRASPARVEHPLRTRSDADRRAGDARWRSPLGPTAGTRRALLASRKRGGPWRVSGDWRRTTARRSRMRGSDSGPPSAPR